MKIAELSWPPHVQDYDEDLLVDVTPGTVVLLIRGRNAWHSTWVRHYLRNATLYTDVPSAKLGAENQRGPGNVFYVIEAPALLLSGEQSNVVLCDAHPDGPFGAFTGVTAEVTQSLHGPWLDGLFPGVSIRDAVAAFRHTSSHWSGPRPSEHSLRTGRLESKEQFDAGSRGMQSLVSRPVGSNYLLQWDPNSKGNRYTREGTRRLARQWSAMVSEVDQGQIDGVTRAKNLAQHRDEVLQALPRSQWLAKKVEAERQARKAAAYARWDEASDRVADLESALWDAEYERDAAREARMTPESTSAGIRAQRERFEVAMAEVDRLRSELEKAEAEVDDLRDQYVRA